MEASSKIVTEDVRAGKPSASGFDRIVRCPGSRAAEAIFPHDEASEIASRGTAIHRALEIGEDEDLVVADKIVAERLRSIESEAIEAWKKELGIEGGDVSIVREQRFWIRERNTLEPLASAQVDCAAIAGTHAIIIDAKSGFLDVPSADVNWQIKTQVIALLYDYPFLIHIRGAISQGRGGSKYDCCDYTTKDFAWVEQELKFYLKLSEQPDAPRVPGSHCRYCRARQQCKESATWALMPYQAAGSLPSKEGVEARVALMTPEELSFIHSRKNIATAIFDAVSDRLKGLPAEELAAIGLELKPNAGMRQISDIQQAWLILKAAGLCDEAEFRAMCKLGIGRVEEACFAKLKAKLKEAGSPKATDKDAKALLNDMLKPVIEFAPKAPSLKPITKQLKE